MNSNDAPLTARGKRQTRRRLARRYGPLVAWLAAIVIAFALGDSAFEGPTAPGAAEEVTITVSAPRDAFVRDVHVELGDRAARGALLMTLESPELERALTEARIELERLQAEVPAKKGAVATDDVSTLERIERLALAAERAALDDAMARADAERDRAELEQIDLQIARQQDLVDKRLASSKTLDALRVKRAALAKAVSQADALLKKSAETVRAARRRYEEFRRERDRGRSPDAMTTLLAPLEASVRAQEARIEHLLAAQAALVVKAPRQGRVLSQDIFAGATVIAGAPLVTLVDDNPRRVIAWAEEANARRITVGDAAVVRPSDRSGPAMGARVVALGAGLRPIPPRFQPVPTEVHYGRQIVLQFDDAGSTSTLPGQAFDVTFLRKPAPAATGAKE